MINQHQASTSLQFFRAGRLRIVISLFMLCIFIIAIGWRVTHGGSRLAEGVTVEAIRAVQNGMSEEEVITILGEPVAYTRPVHYPDTITLTYSKPAYFARWYPMLWVHLRNGKVVEVYAKRYIDWGSDDVGVYGIGDDHRWETDLFEQTFPSNTEN